MNDLVVRQAEREEMERLRQNAVRDHVRIVQLENDLHLRERENDRIRGQALEDAAKAADQLPQRQRYHDNSRDGGWTDYVQSRRDAVKAIRRLIAVPPAGAPERAEALQLALDAAQNAIDDYDENRKGSERRSMEYLRAALALVRTR